MFVLSLRLASPPHSAQPHLPAFSKATRAGAATSPEMRNAAVFAFEGAQAPVYMSDRPVADVLNTED